MTRQQRSKPTTGPQRSSTPSPGNGQNTNQPATWWERLFTFLPGLFKFINSLSLREWLRLVTRVSILLLIVQVSLVMMLLSVNRFFDLRIKTSWFEFSPHNRTDELVPVAEKSIFPAKATQKQVIVEASAGFQNSGIFVRADQHIKLEPEGRIHLSIQQVYNAAKAIKPMIVHYSAAEEFPPIMKDTYPLPSFDKSNLFKRGWVGPEGEDAQSDTYQDCRLRTDEYWGALLAIVMPIEVSSQTDPFKVLAENNLNSGDLIPVSKTAEFDAPQDGYLTFIVNEAVLSPEKSAPECSQKRYEALERALRELGGPHELQSVPLVLFADNLGTFRVTVQADEQQATES